MLNFHYWVVYVGYQEIWLPEKCHINKFRQNSGKAAVVPPYYCSTRQRQ